MTASPRMLILKPIEYIYQSTQCVCILIASIMYTMLRKHAKLAVTMKWVDCISFSRQQLCAYQIFIILWIEQTGIVLAFCGFYTLSLTHKTCEYWINEKKFKIDQIKLSMALNLRYWNDTQIPSQTFVQCKWGKPRFYWKSQ